MSTFQNQHGYDANAHSGLQHFDYSSQAPEVVPYTTLPEVVAAPQHGHQQQYEPQQQYDLQPQQHDTQHWPKQDSEIPSSAYPESQGGWTSVSQRDPAAVQEEEEKPEANGKTILGLRRRKFWLIIGPLLLVLAIGLGVGLGVGLSGRGGSSNGATQSSLPAAPTPLTCPAGNGTIATDDGAKFLVLCNVDYNGNNPSSGTTDLASTNVTSVEQCMDVCATNKDCAGAWYGDFYGLKCFLKSKLGQQGSSDSSIFVIKQSQ